MAGPPIVVILLASSVLHRSALSNPDANQREEHQDTAEIPQGCGCQISRCCNPLPDLDAAQGTPVPDKIAGRPDWSWADCKRRRFLSTVGGEDFASCDFLSSLDAAQGTKIPDQIAGRL